MSKEKRFGADEQPEENRDGNEKDKSGAAGEQVGLGHERNKAFMGRALGIRVKPVVELRRGGEGDGAEPQNQHQSDKEGFADAALTIRFWAKLHV